MRRGTGWIAPVVALAVVAVGCTVGPGSTGTFERTLTVTGPVRLELLNGSGKVEISAGEPGQVRIQGEVRARGWLLGDARARVKEITHNPPIEQQGNLIHIGYDKERLRWASINYTVVVPAETELQAAVGSGRLEVRKINGPAKLTTGSGGITAENIREDVQATAGSGGISLTDVEGEVRATAGSGGIALTEVRGQIRAMTGSGGITIAEPGGRITAKTGSGGVTVSGAAADLRASTGSGRLTIEGNPAPNSYWELRTGSGGVELRVPPSASFRLYARSGSGRLVDTNIPLVIEEHTRRELRARVGGGAARVEVHTGSGGITIR